VHDFIDRNVYLIVDLEVILCAEFSVTSWINDLPVELFTSDLKPKIGGRGIDFNLRPALPL